MERDVPTSFLMFLAYRAAEDRILEAINDRGTEITRAQGRLLAGIDDAGTRLVTLAARARISKQTAVSLVDRLVAQGYVERAVDPDDGRARLVRLTASGERMLPVARSAEQRVEQEWEDLLGEQRMEQLREALTILRAVVDPESQAAK